MPGTSVRIQTATSNASSNNIENPAQASSHQKRRKRQRYNNLKVVKITARPANVVFMATSKHSSVLCYCKSSNAYLLILSGWAEQPCPKTSSNFALMQEWIRSRYGQDGIRCPVAHNLL